jgi:dTDP-4-dehydrorhamnose 3,5-epimerase-like enzyme
LLQTLSPNGAHLTYKCSAVYDPKTEFGVNPFDEHIGIDWPIVDRNVLIVSDRDKANLNLADVNNPF